MPNAEAGAQLSRSGLAGIGPGASDAGTLIFGLLCSAFTRSPWYLTLWACHAVSAVHIPWHLVDWACSVSISALASLTLPFEIVWVIVPWSVRPSWLTLRVDRVSSFDRLIPATLWLVPWKTAT